jgi:hypothetical protein
VATALDAARLLAAGRIAVGSALLAAPGACGRPWMGAGADTPGGAVAVRCFGVRDAFVGAVTLAVLRRDTRAAGALVAAGSVLDATDGLALWAGRRRLPPLAGPIAAGAGATALSGLALGALLRRG